MAYDKMDEYAKTIYSIFVRINKNAKETQNNKFGYISMMIYNYYVSIINDNGLEIEDPERSEDNDYTVDMSYFFGYISANNIELLNFSKIAMDDINVKDKKDIERFVLSHIYYITQK